MLKFCVTFFYDKYVCMLQEKLFGLYNKTLILTAITYKKLNVDAKFYMPHLCDKSYTRTNIRNCHFSFPMNMPGKFLTKYICHIKSEQILSCIHEQVKVCKDKLSQKISSCGISFSEHLCSQWP